MAVGFTYKIKNTFLDIEKLTENSEKRSSSVPRTFKPGASYFCESSRSDDSTSASDNEVHDSLLSSDCGSKVRHSWGSDCDSDGVPDYCTDDESDFICLAPSLTREAAVEDPAGGSSDTCKLCLADMTGEDMQASSKVKLSLVDMVNDKERQKLRSQAKPFKSMRAIPEDATAVVKSAVAALYSSSDIFDVQVQDAGMGGTTMIVGKSSSANPDGRMTLAIVKDALLKAAERSQSTYILAYGAQPFNNLDALSFSANIACVPAAQEATTCWDTYEQGFCPRRSTCCLNHPSDSNKFRIIVLIQKAA